MLVSHKNDDTEDFHEDTDLRRNSTAYDAAEGVDDFDPADLAGWD